MVEGLSINSLNVMMFLLYVIFCDFSAESIRMTRLDLDGFQKSLCPCVLDKSSLSIEKVKH